MAVCDLRLAAAVQHRAATGTRGDLGRRSAIGIRGLRSHSHTGLRGIPPRRRYLYLGDVLMQTQYLAEPDSPGLGTATLRTHASGFAYCMYSNLEISASLPEGCTQATFTSPTWRAFALCLRAPVFEDTRDRSYTCRTASRAFSPLASSPLSQPAHSPRKKSSWSSSPSPFRPSRSARASTSKPTRLAPERAATSAPASRLPLRPCDPEGAQC